MDNMHNNQPELDDELADLTDKLLAGQDMNVSADNESYAKIVKQLHQIVASEPTATPAYRTRLTRRLNDEWDKAHRRQPERVFARPMFRFAALAASVVLVLLVVLVALGQNSGFVPTPGASLGPLTVPTIIFVVALVVIVAIIWQRRR
jgi:hypothetical protein